MTKKRSQLVENHLKWEFFLKLLECRFNIVKSELRFIPYEASISMQCIGNTVKALIGHFS